MKGLGEGAGMRKMEIAGLERQQARPTCGLEVASRMLMQLLQLILVLL
jgi:hypothetical protein